MESTLLNKAGQLAAEKHSRCHGHQDGQNKAGQQAQLIKRIPRGTVATAAVGAPDPDEEVEAMTESPLENLLKKIVKGTTPKPARQAPRQAAGPSGIKIKKESKSPKPSIRLKPSIGKKEGHQPSSSKKKSGLRKAALSGATKAEIPLYRHRRSKRRRRLQSQANEEEILQVQEDRGRKTGRRLGRVG